MKEPEKYVRSAQSLLLFTVRTCTYCTVVVLHTVYCKGISGWHSSSGWLAGWLTQSIPCDNTPTPTTIIYYPPGIASLKKRNHLTYEKSV